VSATQNDTKSHWPKERLRFSVQLNPVKSSLTGLKLEDEVSFVPMEAVGEKGEIETSRTKLLEEVYNGYTYFRNGDVVIAKITPCFENGKGALARDLRNSVGFGTTEFHVIRAEEKTNERWLYYLTTSHQFRNIGASEMLGAGGQKRVPENFIKDFRVALPPLSTQQKIADFLDRKTAQIDALIAKKRSLIAKLKEKRLAVITQAVTRGLNPDAPLKDSGIEWLGKVPAHWEVRRLKDHGKLIGGAGFPHDFQGVEDEALPFYKVGDLKLSRDGIYLSDPPHTISFETARLLRASIISKDSIVYAKIGAALLLNRRRITTKESCIDNNMTAFLPDTEYLEPLWVYFWMSILDFGELVNPGTVPSFSEGYQSTLPIPIPGKEEQGEIVSYISKEIKQVDSLIFLNDETIARLTEYRTALITAAVTGQLKIH
jgi:type I restriction enzyme, S subunit